MQTNWAKLHRLYDRSCEICGACIEIKECPSGPWEGGKALSHPANSCERSGKWFAGQEHGEEGCTGLVDLDMLKGSFQ
jgi:hypothetical protein